MDILGTFQAQCQSHNWPATPVADLDDIYHTSVVEVCEGIRFLIHELPEMARRDIDNLRCIALTLLDALREGGV